MNIGFQELLLIFLIILLLFGAKRLPQLARGMGEAVREFRKAKDGVEKEIEEARQEVKTVEKEAKKTQEDK